MVPALNYQPLMATVIMSIVIFILAVVLLPSEFYVGYWLYEGARNNSDLTVKNWQLGLCGTIGAFTGLGAGKVSDFYTGRNGLRWLWQSGRELPKDDLPPDEHELVAGADEDRETCAGEEVTNSHVHEARSGPITTMANITPMLTPSHVRWQTHVNKATRWPSKRGSALAGNQRWFRFFF